MRTLVLIVCVALLLGCSKHDIPTDKSAPPVTAWVGVTGKSMLPTFPETALVEAEFGVRYDDLKARDTVLYWDYTATPARYLHHRLVAKQGGNWIAQGDNPETNPVADRPWVTRDNFIARTTGKYTAILLAGSL